MKVLIGFKDGKWKVKDYETGVEKEFDVYPNHKIVEDFLMENKIKMVKDIVENEGLIFEGIAKMDKDYYCISDPKTEFDDDETGSTFHIPIESFSTELLKEKIKELRKKFGVE